MVLEITQADIEGKSKINFPQFLRCMYVCVYQSQNRKGRKILPSLSYHSNENNRQMEDDILKSVTYGGH